jgi:outer membrane protein assembly factor BamD (BamD/ComL family)
VDRAFMNIARARAASRLPAELREAIRVYRSIIDLPESGYKPEAQFRIGEVTEEMIRLSVQTGQTPNLSPAMLEYQRVTEQYPHSPFAGEAFKKIINFHLQQQDYLRGVELMDRVVQDYPDAPWLDEILLQWGVAAFRMRNPAVARQKFLQVLEEYPNGQAAAQAANFLQRLQ